MPPFLHDARWDGPPRTAPFVWGEDGKVHPDMTTARRKPGSDPCLHHARWEGRPRTPPFVWGEDGEVLPSHDAWLAELDLRREGLDALLEGDAAAQVCICVAFY